MRWQRDNSNKYPSWRQKELIPRFQQENFAPTKFEIKNIFKFWARGRVFQYLKRHISLCTAHFSSEPTKCKADGGCYNFKFKFTKQIMYVDKMISTNAWSVFILHHHINGLVNNNLRSIQEIMRASELDAKKYNKVCEDFPNLAILTKSATLSKVQ